MDHAAFHIIYVDKRVSANLDGTYLHGIARGTPASEDLTFGRYQRLSCYEQISTEVGVVQDNLGNLLSSFHGGKSHAFLWIELILLRRALDGVVRCPNMLG